MQLKSIISDGDALLAMSPEDLAIAVLRSLNASDDNYARRGQRESFSFTNYCGGQAQQYTSTPQDKCARAISAALQHLVTIGMLIPTPFSHPWGWFQLTDRAKELKDPASNPTRPRSRTTRKSCVGSIAIWPIENSRVSIGH
jgi:hypothetical protein